MFAARETGTQEFLEFRLVEQVGLREAVDPRTGATRELREDGTAGVDQTQPVRRTGDAGEVVGQPEPREDSTHLVVEMHCPGLRVHIRPSVHDQTIHAAVRQ